MADWHWQGADLYLAIRVQSRAAQDELKLEADGRLRLRITAPPVAGKANERLRRFLGRAFGVAPSQVNVIAGERNRNKRIVIRRADPQKALLLGLARDQA